MNIFPKTISDKIVTLEEYSGPGKVRQRHYSACLEDGLQTALNLLKDKPLGI